MRRPIAVLFAIVSVLAATLAGGCQTGNDRPATRPSADRLESFTGVLQSGMMAIGGETTGWRLVGDGETGGIEVDVSGVRDLAERNDGRRVTVTGRMTERQYVERGAVRVLVAQRIEPHERTEPRQP